MATVNLYAGENTLVSNGSGLGFFGIAGFGSPVAIAAYNGRTFVTTTSGLSEGFECNNNQWHSPSSVVHGQDGSGISLQNLPNELSTINLRFTHGEPVYCQQVRMWIFDGTFTGSSANKESPAPNIDFYAAEIRHRSILQSDQSVYTDAVWSNLNASGSNYIGLVNSPGKKGVREGGFEELSNRHDWYVSLTCSPTQLGDKNFGMTVELEYI